MGVDLFEKTWPLYPENGWKIEKLIINLRTGQFKEMWRKEDKNTEKNKAKPMKAQKKDKQKKAVKSMKKKAEAMKAQKKQKKAMKSMKKKAKP